MWLWQSASDSVTEFTGADQAGAKKAVPQVTQTPLTPQQAANQVLAKVGKTTLVSVQANVMVVAASRRYELVLAPKDSRSLVGKVVIAIDGKYGVPLRVQLYAKGATSPAFQVGYTALQWVAPAPANFSFTPPHGASVDVVNLKDQAKSASGSTPDTSTAGFGSYGKSWLTVVALPQKDLMQGFGTTAGSSSSSSSSSGQQNIASSNNQRRQRLVPGTAERPARLGQAGQRQLGERHPGHDQPGLDTHDGRRGLHRRGAAERPVLSGGAHDLMTQGAEGTELATAELAVASSALTKRFRGGQLAVDHVDLMVPRGAVYGFLGPNGSGKTTTIRMLLGLAFPTSGSAELLGVSMPEGSTRVLSRVGSLVEGPAFYPYLSGWDNLARYDSADRTASAKTAKARIGDGHGAGRPDRRGQEAVPQLLASA